jgi:TP901 family phage tail tape measure protein
LNRSIADLNKNIQSLSQAKIGGGQLAKDIQAVAAPKFQWDAGLKQADQLVQTIQKGKLAVNDFSTMWKTQVQAIAEQQAKLSKATVTSTGSGQVQMYVPAKKDIDNFTSSMDLANRKIGIQGELLQGLGTKIQDWGKNTQWAGRQMMVGFTVPFAIAAAASASYALQIDTDITRIEKVYDGSTEGLKQQAMQTANTITQTMGQTADSTLQVMYDLASAGKSGQELMQMTTQAQTLATLGNIDQETSVKSLIAVQNIFGLNTKQTADAVNYLNSVEASTPSSLTDLVNAIPIAGTVVKSFGGTLQDTTVLLSAFREKGISTEEGANAIKNSMARVIEPTKAAIAVFKQLTGQNLQDIVSQTAGMPLETFQALAKAIDNSSISLENQQRIIATVFGKQQFARIDSLLAALNESGGAVAKAQQIADQGPEAWAATTQKHLEAIQQSTSNQFKVAIQNLKNQFQDFGETALKIITVILNGASGIVKFFNGLPAPIKDTAIALATILAIAGPITMVVGLFGNFLGTITKTVGTLLKLKSGYSTLTLEQKAAQLSTGQLTSDMLSEQDTAQILIFQMGKLTRAYTELSQSATNSAIATSEAAKQQVAAVEEVASAAQTLDKIQWASAVQNSIAKNAQAQTENNAWATETQRLVMQNPSFPIKDNRSSGTQTNFGSENSMPYTPWATSVGNMISSGPLQGGQTESLHSQQLIQEEEKVANETEKASGFQKIFSQQSLLAAGAVTMIGSGITGSNRGLSDFLNYVSDILIGLTVMYPLISKIVLAIKDSAAFNSASSLFSPGGITSIVGKLKPMASAATSTFAEMGKGLVSAVLSPAGLAITATGVILFTIFKRQADEQAKQIDNINAISNSTSGWMKMLGQAQQGWGQIRTTTGQVVDSIDAMVQKMRQTNPELVDMLSNLSGKGLDDAVRSEAEKLQGQGLSESNVINALSIGLKAAGKSADDIATTLANLKVKIDFSGSKNDLDQIVHDVQVKLKDSIPGYGGQSGKDFVSSFAGYSQGILSSMPANIDSAAKQFTDSLTSMDDSQKKYAEEKLATQIGSVWNEAYKKLKDNSGGYINQNDLQSAENQLLTMDNGKFVPKGNYRSDDQSQKNFKTAEGLAGIANAQMQLAQSIGKNVGLTDQQIKGIKDLNDVLPLMSNQTVSASDAQDQYNSTIKKAADNGIQLTQAQKDQIAKLYAQADGLSYVALEQNAYNKNSEKTAQQQLDDANAAKVFIDSLNLLADTFGNAASAGQDFWSQMASGNTGFEGLGKTVDDQASTLTNSVKKSYSGAMDQIYNAFSQQASDAFQQRLTDVQNSFEAVKAGIQSQMDSLDKSNQLASQNFSDAWQDKMQSVQDQYKNQTSLIDDQIKSIQDLNAAQNKQFQDEQTRMQRLAQLASNQIDYNKNIATGKLDEAAKVQITDLALQAGWSSQDSIDATNASTQTKVDALNAQKQSLSDQENALQQSLQKQQTMEQRAMADEQQAAKDALQNKLNLISKEESAAQASEQKKQEMQKATLDIQLNSLKSFIPMNEQQLNDHIQRTKDVYGQFGIQLQTSGSVWGQIIGNALQTNVDDARQSMSQDSAWASFGSAVSNAITQGAFGMSLNDFFNMIVTGQAPAGSPLNPAAGGASGPGQRGKKAYHTGGLVGSDPGGRLGITGPLTSGEIETVLQEGEYVINKQAVAKLGANYLKNANLGNLSPGTGGNQTTSAAIFAGGIAHQMRSLLAATLLGMGQQSFVGQVANITTGAYTGAIGSGVKQWTNIVDQALAMLGQPLSWEATVLRRMNQESGGNPNIVNKWDSNWAAGTPSVGLMQVIGPTFRSNAGQFLNTGPFEYGVSVDPLANTYAGLNYALHRYHSLSALNRAGGYDFGGPVSPGWNAVWNGTSHVENMLSGDQENKLYTKLSNKIAEGNFTVSDLSGSLNKIAVNALPSANANRFSTNSAGDTYNINVVIPDGTSLSKTDLKNAIRDGIIEQKQIELKKMGKIK